jgi:hypothetical protein
MNIPDSECPVPKDQRPMNEYHSLKSSVFFLWTTKSTLFYLQDIILCTIPVYLLINALVNASIANSETPLNGLLYTFILCSVLLVPVFLRIYLGWLYVYERLIKASVSYEESGWYDGKTWVKSPENLIQDKLIAKYQLLPIINRLKTSLKLFLGACVCTLSYLHWSE